MLLLNQKDIKRVREQELNNQSGKDAALGLPLEIKDAVLDHDHDTQQCRAVLHRQQNAFLGKIENAYKRYIRPYTDKPLTEVLRDLALYLEQDGLDYVHPSWQKHSLTEFRKLSAKQKDYVLRSMSVRDKQQNNATREKAFRKALRALILTYGEVLEVINYAKTFVQK